MIQERNQETFSNPYQFMRITVQNPLIPIYPILSSLLSSTGMRQINKSQDRNLLMKKNVTIQNQTRNENKKRTQLLIERPNSIRNRRLMRISTNVSIDFIKREKGTC